MYFRIAFAGGMAAFTWSFPATSWSANVPSKLRMSPDVPTNVKVLKRELLTFNGLCSGFQIWPYGGLCFSVSLYAMHHLPLATSVWLFSTTARMSTERISSGCKSAAVEKSIVTSLVKKLRDKVLPPCLW
jgi:hypothetical protein